LGTTSYPGQLSGISVGGELGIGIPGTPLGIDISGDYVRQPAAPEWNVVGGVSAGKYDLEGAGYF